MDILLKFNFAENFSRIKGPSKTRRKKSQSILKAEIMSQLKLVTTRSSSIQLFPGHDITKTSLEREIEGFIKLVMTEN